MRQSVALSAALVLLAAARPAPAAEVCAWMLEVAAPDDVRQLDLWLQSDADVDLFYALAGDGLVDATTKAHSPSSGTLSLDAGKPERPWGFGATFSPPGRIDVILRLHAKGASVFGPPGPVLAEFAFRREVPAGEAAVPPVLAKKQCAKVQAPR